MDAVIRAALVYAGLLALFRVVGNRALGQVTSFDFVLLLIIAEATQQALSGSDYSVARAGAVVITLVALNHALDFVKGHWRAADKVLEGVPVILVEHGRPLRERLRREGVDEADVLHAAREQRGLERMEQIKYAVLERSGGISIIQEES